MKNNNQSPRILSHRDVVDLVKSVDKSIRAIEIAIGIPKNILGKAVAPVQIKPLPYKWEKPLIDYVKKYHAEKKELAKDQTEILAKVKGEVVPEKIPEHLSEEELASKKAWHKKVHDAVSPFVVTRFLTGE